jgi:hypothetical protein
MVLTTRRRVSTQRVERPEPRTGVGILDYARRTALYSYKHALSAGAEPAIALEVALARLRASHPAATEWRFRFWLAEALAAERRGVRPSRLNGRPHA